MENLFGLIDVAIGVNGSMVSNMVKELMLLVMVKKSMENGKMEKELDG